MEKCVVHISIPLLTLVYFSFSNSIPFDADIPGLHSFKEMETDAVPEGSEKKQG